MFTMKYNKNTFVEKGIIKHDGKYDYSLVEYVNSQTKVKIICHKHGVFEQTPSMHLLRNGCPLCGNEQKSIKKLKDLNWFMNRAMLIHDGKYDYSLVEYVNSQTKVKIVCSKHGIFEQTPNAHLSGKQGCPYCRASKGEIIIKDLLDSNQINYISEKKFDDCKNLDYLYYDFYIEEQNLLIEFDGIQHYKSIEYFGGDDGLLNQQYRDKIKNEYALKNNFEMIRIKYNQINNIETILKNEKVIK